MIVFALAVAGTIVVLLGVYAPQKIFYFCAAIFHAGIFLNLFYDYDIALSRFLVACLVLAFAVLVIQKRARVHLDITGLLLLFFLLLAAFSLLYAGQFGFGIRKFLYFASTTPLYFAALCFANTERKLEKLIAVNLWCGGIVAALGVLQFAAQFIVPHEQVVAYLRAAAPLFYGKSFSVLVLNTPSWFVHVGGQDYMRAISIFPDPHTFSLYLGFFIPLCASRVYFWPSAGRKIAAVGLGCGITALVFTFSRGGYIALLVSFFVLLFFGFPFLKRPYHALFALCAILFVIAAAFISPVGERFMQSFEHGERSTHDRAVILDDALSLWTDNFFFGVGIGNYAYAANRNAFYRSPINAHNTYLEIASELGFFGFAVWVLILFFACFALVRALKRRIGTDDRKRISLLLGLLGALVWFLVNGFFETAVYWPVVFLLFLEYLAVASFYARQRI